VVPAIATVPPDDAASMLRAIGRLAEYDWVVFTSAAAVDSVFDVLDEQDGALPASIRVAAVGPATADAVRTRGAFVHAMPRTFRGEEIAAALGACARARVLVPRSDIARPETVAVLRERGALVDDVVAYRTVVAVSTVPPVDDIVRGVDAITFTSPSAVRGLAQMTREPLAGVAAGATIACIGPTTSGAARELGLGVDVEPAEHTSAALVAELDAYESRGLAREPR